MLTLDFGFILQHIRSETGHSSLMDPNKNCTLGRQKSLFFVHILKAFKVLKVDFKFVDECSSLQNAFGKIPGNQVICIFGMFHESDHQRVEKLELPVVKRALNTRSKSGRRKTALIPGRRAEGYYTNHVMTERVAKL